MGAEIEMFQVDAIEKSYYHVPSVLPRYLVFHHRNDKTL